MRALRPGLVLLAAVEVVLGLWTLLFPASFYADVPTVDATPPFGHLHGLSGTAAPVLVIVLAGSVLLPVASLGIALRHRPSPSTSPRHPQRTSN